MHKIESEEDIDALHGEIEGATLEIKGTNKAGELIKTERLIQIIQSFMNGAEPEGLIIIGVGENEQSELDSSKKCPIR